MMRPFYEWNSQIFWIEHPAGTVIGRGTIDDGFFFIKAVLLSNHDIIL